MLMRGEPAVRLDSPILEMYDELVLGPALGDLGLPPPLSFCLSHFPATGHLTGTFWGNMCLTHLKFFSNGTVAQY